MKISKDLKFLTTTQTELARAIGITQPRVNQLIQDGIVIKDEGGSVLVIESLQNFYKTRSGGDSTEQDNENPDYWVEKAKHEQTKREISELKLAKMESNVYDARTVELVLTEMLSNLRTQLLGLPAKMAPTLVSKSREQIYESMTKEIEDKLGELSEYSPELFTQEEIDNDEESD